MLDYHEKLDLAKFPNEVLVIDFETYFDAEYTLSKMSTVEYIVDPRFEFLGVGWSVSPNFIAGFSYSVESTFKGFQTRYGKNLEGITVVIQNARYDATVLQERLDIVPPYIVDTVDLARHYDSRMSHHLKDLAKMFHLEAKGDTMDFKGLHLKDMTPEQLGALKQYCKTDIRITSKLFVELMKLLTWPEVELPIARHTLGMYLNPRLNFDFQLGTEIFANMEKLLNDIVEPTGFSKKLLGSKKPFCEELENLLPEREHVPYKQGKNEMIPALAKADELFQELLNHPDDKVRELCNARQAVKSWPIHIKRVKRMRDQALASYGQMRVPLNYYGCHTGRPSGGEKINLLNLGGKGRTGQGTHKLISMVRKLLVAPPGKTLVLLDSQQIECRLAAWLSGQTDLLDGFANGEDIYSEFSSNLFGCEVRKPLDDDSPELRHSLDMMRGFGKDAILGCQFGMGPKRFYKNCRSNPDLRPLFDDGTYTYAFIKRLIKSYQSTYSQIPKFWSKIESLFKFVIQFPGETAYYSRHGSEFKFRGVKCEYEPAGSADLTLWNDNGTVCLQLPSGRVLYYRHASVGRDGTIRWQWGHLWGGSLCENLCQSIARDLFTLWILECEKEEIPVVLQCYDEIVGLVDEADGEDCLSIVDEIMREAPDWAEGMPLATDKMISKFYTK